MKIRAVTVVLLALTLAWSAAIFSFSSDNGEQSGGKSEAVCRFLLNTFDRDFDEMPLEKQQEKIDGIQFLVRKTAHFCSYALLSALSCLTLISAKVRKSFLLSLGYSLIFALSDEFHQTFVAGRSGQLGDVVIDFCGALLGAAAAFLITLAAGKLSLSKKLQTTSNGIPKG